MVVCVCAQYATPRLDGITNKTTRTSVELRVALGVCREREPSETGKPNRHERRGNKGIKRCVCVWAVDCLVKYVFACVFSLSSFILFLRCF